MFNLFKNVNNNEIKIDEEKLFKKYGCCRTLNSHINVLVITDTHGNLSINPDLQYKLQNIKNYDLCCALGDITYSDYEIILKYVPKQKIVALLGNHDGFDVLNYYKLNDLNGKIININGIRIGGIQGSYRYKSEDFPSFTHKESIEFLDNLDEVDILLSHSGPFLDNNSNPVHNGLKGITNYLYKNRVPYNIHGHNHVSKSLYLQNETKIFETYLIELLEI